MALADHPELYTIWVATNVDVSAKLVPFVLDVLEDLRRLLGLVPNDTGVTPDSFEKRCVEFARCRIKKEVKLLRTVSKNCLSNPRNNSSQKGWLSSESS
jgi:hypothetical protein